MEHDNLSNPLDIGNGSPPELELTIGELAEQARVSRRTVRFYVQRGLIDPPAGRGRGSAYTRKHLEQIQRVLRLQRTGLPLDSISELGAAPEPKPESELPPVSAWVLRIPLGHGVILEVPAASGQPSPTVIRELTQACQRILNASADDTAETGAES